MIKHREGKLCTNMHFNHHCQASNQDSVIIIEPSDFDPFEVFCTCSACGFEWFQSASSILSTETVDN